MMFPDFPENVIPPDPVDITMEKIKGREIRIPE
jgi:hypothetical protein